ncbi:hypothetical protein B0T25DRAFT_573762 [Lasiosphaeria hispida]|uniref:Uncharacterized protein n=1 Tax=Lasiosphaeria hispida TaxID=260671 RepID=A0AAJ0H662_9PEZI|nr:hypothetical protein B0T25DRAFT_573762 [Lasiosphaeria hispida]
MNFRGYGLPIHAGYAPYHPHPRRPQDRRSDPEYLGSYPLGTLSIIEELSSGSNTSRYAGWARDASPGAMTTGESDNKLAKAKQNHSSDQKNFKPGIDVALRNLDQEVAASLKIFQGFVQGFEDQVQPLKSWTEDYTLDAIWKDKVKDKFREQREKERVVGVAERLSFCRDAVKDAVAKAKRFTPARSDKYSIERQIRTAKKALVYCDALVDLAKRAVEERVASRQLVDELGETKDLLHPKRHPWIYGNEDAEKHSDGGDGAGGKSKIKRGGQNSPDGLEAEDAEDTKATQEGHDASSSDKAEEPSQDKSVDQW